VAFTRGFDGDEQPMAEINTTPLVDVMLVLLVIFIVTAPLLTHGVRVDLPRVRAAPATEAPASVVLSLDASGALRIDGEIVGESQLPQRLAAFAARAPQPEIRFRADRMTRYERVAKLLAQLQDAGLVRLAFVTDPLERP